MSSTNGDGAVEGVAFRKVEQRMIDLLSDGEFHTIAELHGCLWDTDSPHSNVHMHLNKIRKKLRAISQDIQTEQTYGQLTRFRHVKIFHLAKSN